MNALLNAIRAVAREDDREMAAFSAEVALLSDETRNLISERILQTFAKEKAAQEPDAAMVDEMSHRRRRVAQKRSLFLAAAGLVAVAAVLTMWMRPPAEVDGLPGYAVSATGGVAELRGRAQTPAESDGSTAPLQRLRAESELRITCRPDRAVAGPVAVRAFFVQGTTVEEVSPLVQTAATGAVELRVRGGAIVERHSGEGSLRVLVGRPDRVREFDSGSAAAAASGSAWRWLTVPLLIEKP